MHVLNFFKSDCCIKNSGFCGTGVTHVLGSNNDGIKPWCSHLSGSADESPAAAVSSVKSVFSRKAVVRMQLLKEVVGSDSYRVNNKYDHNHTPLPICEIIQRAQVLIGQEVSYDLLGSNCEHFVTLLRYGEGVSEQVSHCLFCVCLMCLTNLSLNIIILW